MARREDSSAGSAAVCDYLTQRARPQLFTNALPPTVAASSLASIEYLEAHPERVTRLRENARYFREQLLELGFKPLPGETPIIPVILGETAAAIRMSDLLLAEGVFVTGFGYPVVPQGQARVRCQISAAHTRDDLDQALDGLRTGREEARIDLADQAASERVRRSQSRQRSCHPERSEGSSAAVEPRKARSLSPRMTLTMPSLASTALTAPWPTPCTPTPIDGLGSGAAAICKVLTARQIAVIATPTPSRAFQQFSRILTYRADWGRGRRQGPPGADTLRRQSVMRMVTRSIPVAALALCLGAAVLSAQEPGNGNFQWYVGGQAGAMIFGTPTRTPPRSRPSAARRSSSPSAPACCSRSRKRLGSDERQLVLATRAATQAVTFNDIRKYSAVLMAFPIKAAAQPYFGVGYGIMHAVNPGGRPHRVERHASELGSTGFGTLLGGLTFQVSRFMAFGQYQITTSPSRRHGRGCRWQRRGGRGACSTARPTRSPAACFGLGSAREGVKTGGY